MNLWQYAAQLALAAVVGVVAAVALQERIEAGVIRLLGRKSGRAGDIKGFWFSVFWYRGIDGAVHPVMNILRIRRIGKKVVLTTEVGPGAYRASGSIALGQFVTCTWHNQAGANQYNGSCQWVLAPEGISLAGVWIGWNKDRHVSAGPWVLAKVGGGYDRSSLPGLFAELNYACSTPQHERLSSGAADVFDAVLRSTRHHATTHRDADWAEALGSLGDV